MMDSWDEALAELNASSSTSEPVPAPDATSVDTPVTPPETPPSDKLHRAVQYVKAHGWAQTVVALMVGLLCIPITWVLLHGFLHWCLTLWARPHPQGKALQQVHAVVLGLSAILSTVVFWVVRWLLSPKKSRSS